MSRPNAVDLSFAGGIVLCGGQSSRMGLPKATLPFGNETLLTRVVRIVSSVVQPVVVVAAADQPLPPLPPQTLVTRDELPGRGPLQGMAAGLSALPHRVTAAYVTGCDVPLLVPAFVRRMLELLEDFEIAIPLDGERHHPLAAVYRVTILDRAVALLAADQLRPRSLLELARTRRVPVAELSDIDPELDSLRNLNRREEYIAALARAGLETP
jgi:molybdopterin-guanine dinucleotide biosynthesis protein A